MRTLRMLCRICPATGLLFALGCGGTDAPLPVITLTPADVGHTVALRVGQELEFPMEAWTAASGPAFRYDCSMTPSGVLDYEGAVAPPSGGDGLFWRGRRVGTTEVTVTRSPVGPLMIPVIERTFIVIVER